MARFRRKAATTAAETTTTITAKLQQEKLAFKA